MLATLDAINLGSRAVVDRTLKDGDPWAMSFPLVVTGEQQEG